MVENVARVFARQIQQRCEAKVITVGDAPLSYPVLVRYSFEEWCEGGRTLEEGVEIARVLEQVPGWISDYNEHAPTRRSATAVRPSIGANRGQ